MAMAEYEFTEAQNEEIDLCAQRAKRWGRLAIVVGFLQGAACVLNVINGDVGASLGLLVGAILSSVVGLGFTAVAKSPDGVVQTEGSDITLMMSAVRELSRALYVQTAAVCVGVALTIVALFFLGVEIARM